MITEEPNIIYYRLSSVTQVSNEHSRIKSTIQQLSKDGPIYSNVAESLAEKSFHDSHDPDLDQNKNCENDCFAKKQSAS